MGDRCTGHCCREFTLPDTPEGLAASKNVPKGSDRRFWSRNAIFLRFSSGRYYYTCKQYDLGTGNCKAYETRPWTCRMYPEYLSGEKCSNAGCTWTEHRAHGGDLITGKYTCTTEKSRIDHMADRLNRFLTIGGRYRVRRRDP